MNYFEIAWREQVFMKYSAHPYVTVSAHRTFMAGSVQEMSSIMLRFITALTLSPHLNLSVLFFYNQIHFLFMLCESASR